MLWRCVGFGMSVEAKFDAVVFGVVEVITVFLCPDDVEASTGTRPKPCFDGHAQFGLWVEPTVETVMADQWFGREKDVSYLF